jgi:hypothetical protein
MIGAIAGVACISLPASFARAGSQRPMMELAGVHVLATIDPEEMILQ